MPLGRRRGVLPMNCNCGPLTCDSASCNIVCAGVDACASTTRANGPGTIRCAVSDAFARHLPSCTCPHAFQGRDRYHATGARRFIQYLRTVGIIASVAVEPEPVVPLL